MTIPPSEFRQSFPDISSWQAFWHRSPWIHDKSVIERIVATARATGVRSAALGAISPDDIEVRGANYRETFCAGGFNSRQRTVIELVHEHLREASPSTARIFAHEALTSLALYYRGRYHRFIGSEYATSPEEAAELEPILAVDITRSPFRSALFDLVISCDVLEHVPDLAAAVLDTARILKPGGAFIATFPFDYGRYETTVKAVLLGGRISHLTEPEYHGNPMDPENGSLVFQIPGWSILDLLRESGFRSAEFVFWSSTSRGFTATELCGNLVLKGTR